MKRTVLFLFLLSFCAAHKYNITCTNDKEVGNRFRFEPSDDVVKGRYLLECCMPVNSTIKSWELLVTVDHRRTNFCRGYNSATDNADKHSLYTFEIGKKYDCSNLCLSTELDLVYSGCYTIKNSLEVAGSGSKGGSKLIHIQLRHIANGLTQKYFKSTQTLVSALSYNEDVQIRFHFGSIPLTDYYLDLCNDTSLYGIKSNYVDIKRHCSQRSSVLLECRLTSLPVGEYELYLQHSAPWANGDIFRDEIFTTTTHRFVHSEPPSAPDVSSAGSGLRSLYWGAGGVGGLLLGGLCVWGVREWGARRRRRGEVLKAWRGERHTYEEQEEQEEAEEPGELLLLYARDCEPFMKAVGCLRDILRDGGTCKVYDMFDPSLQPSLAPSPTEWVRAALSSPRTRILFLQTPTAHQLYGSGPLLPGRVLYRRPHHADWLLQYALRLLLETAHRPLVYRKYYLATLSSMPTEMVPAVAPFRRYLLPEHTERLALDAARSPCSPDMLVRFAAALSELTEYVRSDPDYLREELLFL